MKTTVQARQFQGMVGEITPLPVAGYDPMTERALDDVGAILRRQRGMTVGQAKALSARVRHDAQIQASVVTMESRYAVRQERVDHLRAKVEAGAYRAEGEEIAACMLSYPAFRDYERRRDYHVERFRQAAGVGAEVDVTPDDGAWEEPEARAFWRTLWTTLIVLAGVLTGVAWLLLAIHTP